MHHSTAYFSKDKTAWGLAQLASLQQEEEQEGF